MEITQEIIVHFRSQQRKWTIYFRFIYPGWSIIQLELLCGFEQRYLFIQLWGVKRVNADCDPLESPFFLLFFSYYSRWINHNILNTHNWIVLGHPPLWNILPIHQHFVSGLLLLLNNATLIDAHLIDVRWSQCSFDKFPSPCSDPHWIGSRLKCRNETFCWFNGPRLSKSSSSSPSLTIWRVSIPSAINARCAFETWWMVLMVSQGEFRGWVPSNWPRPVSSRLVSVCWCVDCEYYSNEKSRVTSS